jgi:4-hydroxybenzoate polyprenyltransferase
MQDFMDTDGDRMLGRRTLPIVAPEGSRIYMLCVLPVLSLALVSFWSLGPISSALFISLGLAVGLRCFLFRGKIRDQSTFLLYNVRIID